MKKVITILSLAIIFLFTGLFIFTPARKSSVIENRNLAQSPKINFADIKSGQYMDDFETYISDQFPFRDTLLKTYIKLNTKTVSMPDANYKQMIEGTDGYNFYVYDDNEILKVYNSKKDNNTAYVWADLINKTDDYCQKNDIDFIVDFIPSKTESLNDMLPKDLANNKDKPIRELIERESNDSVVFVDTMSEFSKQPLQTLKTWYFNTDHHWNMLGAYNGLKVLDATLSQKLGLNSIDSIEMKAYELEQDYLIGSYNRNLGDIFPKTEKLEYWLPHDLSYFDTMTVETKDGVVSADKVIATITSGEWVTYGSLNTEDLPLIHLHNDAAANNYSICILKDSYFNAMIPNISLMFNDVYVVDNRYYENFILDEFVKENKIDGVMFFFNSMSFIQETQLPQFKIH